jgi:hypothetical protein
VSFNTPFAAAPRTVILTLEGTPASLGGGAVTAHVAPGSVTLNGFTVHFTPSGGPGPVILHWMAFA